MNMPDFLIIGTAKAGTTSLYKYLAQHRNIYFAPKKEPHFFTFAGVDANFRGPNADKIAASFVTDRRKYSLQFQGARKDQLCGEASTGYLYSPNAPSLIKKHNPDVKLIAILRNPAERAYSQFLYHRRDGIEPIPDFDEALDAEQQRIVDGWWISWHYLQMGFYYQQLSRYLELFDPAQIKLVLYEDFLNHRSNTVADILAFLGVDSNVELDTSSHFNASGEPKNPLLHRFVRYDNPAKAFARKILPGSALSKLQAKVFNWNLRQAEPMNAATRHRLINAYREDILQLQNLLGRDLSAWTR